MVQKVQDCANHILHVARTRWVHVLDAHTRDVNKNKFQNHYQGQGNKLHG